MASPGFFDPYNHISYLELNKRKRGDYQRDESERIENRTPKPTVRKLYIKRNGESRKKRPKLFVWREWKIPGMRNLYSELSTFLGEEVVALYDSHGYRISDSEELQDQGTYYVTGDETLLIPTSDEEDFARPENNRSKNHQPRYTSLSAPEFSSTSRNTLYEPVSYPLTPPPNPTYANRQLEYVPPFSPPSKLFQTSKNVKTHIANDYNFRKSRTHHSSFPRRKLKQGITDYEKYYELAMQSQHNAHKEPETRKVIGPKKKSKNREEEKYRSRSVHDEVQNNYSDFDHHEWTERDRQALAKHKEKLANRTRSSSAVIYNRRDQTHPDAYIIYVFLNGQGMECQFINFQKSQLAKGMNYVLELVARKYNVNPLKLCNMDGKKINEVYDLMSRGAYVLVPAGQTFRDTWYFLPDNAIDTSVNRERIEERSEQRDRLIQKREKKLKSSTANQQYVPTSHHYNPKIRSEDRRAEYDLYSRRY